MHINLHCCIKIPQNDIIWAYYNYTIRVLMNDMSLGHRATAHVLHDVQISRAPNSHTGSTQSDSCINGTQKGQSKKEQVATKYIIVHVQSMLTP